MMSGTGKSWNDLDWEDGHRLEPEQWNSHVDAHDTLDSRITDAEERLDTIEVDTINVGNHGFPGDESGGDIATFIHNNGPADFEFPEGRYSIEQNITPDSLGWSQFKLEGLGNGATFVVNDSACTDMLDMGDSSSNTDIAEIKNITLEVDASNDMDAGIGRLAANEAMKIEDVTLSGVREYSRLGGSIYGIRVNMLNPGSTGIVTNLRMMDGDQGEISTNFGRAIGVAVEGPNEGSVIWNGCHLADWPGNGYYLKDGTGSSTVIGCSAQNCGTQHFRLGQGDQMIGCRTLTDADSSTLAYTLGTHIDIQRGEGTSVMGHRAIAETADTELIRCRSGNEHQTIRDMYVHNSTTVRTIRTSASETGDDQVDTAGEGMMVFENCRIIVDSDDTSSDAVGAIVNRRENTVYKDCSIKIGVPETAQAAVYAERGDVSFSDCRFDMTDTNSAGYSVVLGPNDSSGDPLGSAIFTRTDFDGGVYRYSGDPDEERVVFRDCDMTEVSTIFPDTTPNNTSFHNVEGITLSDVPDGVPVDGSVLESSTTGTPSNSYEPGTHVRTDGWYVTNPDGTFDGPL